jgi:hypothetical protein
MTTSRVFALNGASQCRVTKEKCSKNINKNRVQHCQVSMGALNRTHAALKHTWVFKDPAVQHLNNSARANMVLGSIVAFLGSSADALGHTTRDLLFLCLFPPSNRIFFINDLQHIKTSKLTKTLENNKGKSLTNIS